MGKVRDFWQRLNRSVTEVGVEHFDDDRDWDVRVKLPAWQTARLEARYAESKRRGRLGKQVPADADTTTKPGAKPGAEDAHE
ncbi:MAG: hypothetical protein AAF529_06100 [Pseudomonadota bacterium]